MSENVWDSHAKDWDQDEAPRAYAKAAFSSLLELMEEGGLTLVGAHVLDFGCGTGLLTEQLVATGATVHAVDTSPAMLDVLKSKVVERQWTGVITSAEPPVTAQEFDLIVCSSVCSFLDDYPGTVNDLVSLLRPGGLFVQWDWERSGEDSHGLSKDEITEALRQAGLIDVSVKTAFSILIDDKPMSPLLGHGWLIY